MGALGIVVLILLAGNWLKSEWADWDVAPIDLAQLKRTRDEIKGQFTALEQALRKQVPDMGTPISVVAEKRKRFDQELPTIDEQIRRIERENRLAVRIPGSQAFIQLIRAKAERVLLQQAKDYTDQLHELLVSTRNCQVQMLDAKARMLQIAASIHKTIQELEELKQAAGIRLLNPFSDANKCHQLHNIGTVSAHTSQCGHRTLELRNGLARI